MPLFTSCNIGLGCPQNVSVNFSAKNTHRSFITTENVIFGVCLKNSCFGLYHFKCKWAVYSGSISRRGHHICLSALHTYSNKQPVEATWLRARVPVFSRTYGKSNAECGTKRYRACVLLTCHRHSSMDRAARPSYRTNSVARTNLTSVPLIN